MATRSDVFEVKKKLAAFILMLLDEEDNMDQLLPMLSNIGEAGLLGYRLFHQLDEKDRMMAGIDIADGIKEVFMQEYLVYSDEVVPEPPA